VTEGERWARELLVELRAARFRPRAWVRFLHRSFARASERRRERARAHRQTVALGASGLAVWGGIALAGHPALAAAGAAWWLLIVLMLDWHLGLLERPDGRPLSGLGRANFLSTLRAAAAPAMFVLPPWLLAVALFVACAADVLDGRLARARDETTRLGLWLDGVADGVVLGAVALAGAAAGVLPWWAAAAVLARHVLPWTAIALGYFLLAEPPRPEGRVAGTLPGLVLFAGLTASLLGVPGAPLLVVIGSVGGLVLAAAGRDAFSAESGRT